MSKKGLKPFDKLVKLAGNDADDGPDGDGAYEHYSDDDEEVSFSSFQCKGGPATYFLQVGDCLLTVRRHGGGCSIGIKGGRVTLMPMNGDGYPTVKVEPTTRRRAKEKKLKKKR